MKKKKRRKKDGGSRRRKCGWRRARKRGGLCGREEQSLGVLRQNAGSVPLRASHGDDKDPQPSSMDVDDAPFSRLRPMPHPYLSP